jgi:transposase
MKQPNFAAMNPVVAKAIEQMMAEQGEEFSLEKINLAELGRRTGISRQKLRSMKANGFEDVPHAAKGRKSPATLLSGYTGILDALLKSGVTNSAVCFDRLKKSGYAGGLTTVKVYIASHQYLIPPQRHVVAPQGNRGRRYLTPPGEAFQMDWGFTKVQCFDGSEYNAACFAMVCHHCGQQFIEFFPNAKQENLFIGMIHAFRYMGIPKTVLTDNMKSVVIRRDQDGHSVWQKDYEQFMRTVASRRSFASRDTPLPRARWNALCGS